MTAADITKILDTIQVIICALGGFSILWGWNDIKEGAGQTQSVGIAKIIGGVGLIVLCLVIMGILKNNITSSMPSTLLFALRW